VAQAIEQAKRTQGWNNRCGNVRRFELANLYEYAPCVLYVVPGRRWAYRLNERQAEAWRAEHGGHAAWRQPRACLPIESAPGRVCAGCCCEPQSSATDPQPSA
jgi:hypothetical protein